MAPSAWAGFSVHKIVDTQLLHDDGALIAEYNSAGKNRDSIQSSATAGRLGAGACDRTGACRAHRRPGSRHPALHVEEVEGGPLKLPAMRGIHREG